jgi:hypothetical protein
MIILNGCGCFDDTTFMQGSKGFRPFSDLMRKIGCEEYYKNKLALGIPAGIIKTPKVIKNPYTKQYFLGKIDERY